MSGPFYQQNADLVQHPDGEGHQRQRKDVGGGGDDGRNDEDDHDGMLAETLHEGRGQDAQLAQEPAQHREFKDDAHEDVHHHEGADVGL